MCDLCPGGDGSFRRGEAFDFRDKSRGSVYISFRRIRMVNVSILKPLLLFYFKGGRDQQKKKKNPFPTWIGDLMLFFLLLREMIEH